ncbi:MAG: heme transporter ATP-binding protein [Flaviaesturariibacter sp.]|nr:heme transporter ATP-binding protein [Flaviaesturariibacter sp.]
MLRAEGISFRAGPTELVSPVTIGFDTGLFHVVMGANGAGKSTLLRMLAGDLRPTAGTVWLDDRKLEDYSRRDLAKRRAVLSQQYHIAFPLAVSDLVSMGRYPYAGTAPATEESLVCGQALEAMQMQAFADRDYNTLSGGEAQKVQMCRVLAQIDPRAPQGKVLFLDEPVSHLDIRYQHQLLRTAKALCRNGATVIAVLHDMNLAIAFADRLLFMKEGKLAHRLDDVRELTPAIIADVFDMDARILHPEGHPPVVIF